MLITTSLTTLLLVSAQITSALAIGSGQGTDAGNGQQAKAMKLRLARRTPSALTNPDGTVDHIAFQRGLDQMHHKHQWMKRNAAANAHDRQASKRHEAMLQNAVDLEMRYKATKRGAKKRGASELHLQTHQGFYGAEMSFGTPPQPFNVQVDTGTSDLLVAGAGIPTKLKTYNAAASSTAQDTKALWNTSFPLGYIAGKMYQDVVRLGDFTVKKQDFGLELSTTPYHSHESKLLEHIQFTSYSAELGLAFSTFAINQNPTFMENLIAAKAVPQPLFALSLENGGGELTIGGIDSAKYKGKLTWVPVEPTGLWEVACDGLALNGKRAEGTDMLVIMSSSASVTLLPKAVAAALFAHIPRAAQPFKHYDYYVVPCSSANSTTLGMSFGGQVLEVPLAALVTGHMASDPSMCILNISGYELVDPSGKTAAVVGATLFRAFYTVYSYSHEGKPAMGFAQSTFLPEPIDFGPGGPITRQ